MTTTYNSLKRRRDAGEVNGFTLIEIMIVIVVLGILAAVVIFALGGIVGKSAVSACQADGSTVSSAMADFNNQNPGIAVTTGGLLSGTPLNNNNSYIQSWPTNTPHYAFEISTGAGSPANATAANQLMVSITPAGNVNATVQGNYNPYTGPSSCNGAA